MCVCAWVGGGGGADAVLKKMQNKQLSLISRQHSCAAFASDQWNERDVNIISQINSNKRCARSPKVLCHSPLLRQSVTRVIDDFL